MQQLFNFKSWLAASEKFLMNHHVAIHHLWGHVLAGSELIVGVCRQVHHAGGQYEYEGLILHGQGGGRGFVCHLVC